MGTLDKYQDSPSPLVLLWNGELGLWMSPPPPRPTAMLYIGTDEEEEEAEAVAFMFEEKGEEENRGRGGGRRKVVFASFPRRRDQKKISYERGKGQRMLFF